MIQSERDVDDRLGLDRIPVQATWGIPKLLYRGVMSGDPIFVPAPNRALILVREWAMMHREELREDWRLCRTNAVPEKIEPLA